MLSTLASFDNVTAAGVLARMALALDSEANPAARSQIPNELNIRLAVMAEVRRALGIAPGDETQESMELLGNALDTEGDSLLGPLDLESALASLSKKGQLPSDLYEVEIQEHIADFCGEKFSREKHLIELTVSSPDQEQHFGDPGPDSNSHLISLFAKHFPDANAYNSFTLLVMAQRAGRSLTVSQAWRLYPDRINLRGVVDLVDVVRRFSDVLGCEMELDGQRGKFFLRAEMKIEESNAEIVVLPRTVRDGRGRKREVGALSQLTFFSQTKPMGGKVASLVVSVDLNMYRRMLEAHGW